MTQTEWMKESIKNHQRSLERRASAQKLWLQLLCSLQHPLRCQRRVTTALKRWERNKTKSKSLHRPSQKTRSLHRWNNLRNLIPAIQSARQPTRTWRKPLKLWVKHTALCLYTILMLRNQDTDISNWLKKSQSQVINERRLGGGVTAFRSIISISFRNI